MNKEYTRLDVNSVGRKSSDSQEDSVEAPKQKEIKLVEAIHGSSFYSFIRSFLVSRWMISISIQYTSYTSENKDLMVHGWISHEPPVGLWQITLNNEFRSGWPLKRNLSIQDHFMCMCIQLSVACGLWSPFLLILWLFVMGELSTLETIRLIIQVRACNIIVLDKWDMVGDGSRKCTIFINGYIWDHNLSVN
ncbi:hypothetical protein HanRHA438_Chr07g0325831 [Helianthus annuus]|nr:hypothetical protein HanIR_Chr07g0340781 [Helianthus annuus]KAJ0564711.1 hypothetical protein HanHA89_Chr07g0277301 [Helianthus annuus]KAJ0906411.1 hypothetical protein HanPSC8_Chr07g0305131 [Helianthus annuus]KAJ0909834.1 hypothetical protein HanRHA438_Chr07g0325831 [Helianthus annuus]